MTLSLGPLSRTMETVPSVVGSQVTEKFVPAGTSELRPGWKMGLP